MIGRTGHLFRTCAAIFAAGALTLTAAGCSGDDGGSGATSTGAAEAPAGFRTVPGNGFSVAVPEGFRPVDTVPTQAPSGNKQLALSTEPGEDKLRAVVVVQLIAEPERNASEEAKSLLEAAKAQEGREAEQCGTTWNGRPAQLVTSRGAEPLADGAVIRSESLVTDLPDGRLLAVSIEADDGTFTELGLDRVPGTVRVG